MKFILFNSTIRFVNKKTQTPGSKVRGLLMRASLTESSGGNKDFLAKKLMTNSHGENDKAVSILISAGAQEVTLPKTDSLSHRLHPQVFIFDSAA